MAQDYNFLFKLLLVGNQGVGKSSIMHRFADNVMPAANAISSIGVDFKIKTLALNEKKVKLQVWDTAGQERFKTITSSYYRGASGIVLVYDIADKSSFEALEHWAKQIQSLAPNALVILLGNKCDLAEQRQVAKSAGKEYASERDMLFMESSAQDGTNVQEAFTMLSYELMKRQEKAAAAAQAEEEEAAPPPAQQAESAPAQPDFSAMLKELEVSLASTLNPPASKPEASKPAAKPAAAAAPAYTWTEAEKVVLEWLSSHDEKPKGAPMTAVECSCHKEKVTSVPAAVFQISTLEKLDLGDNALDKIDDAIGQLSLLKNVDLCRNKISVLPASFWSLKHLRVVDLSHNMLTEIPDAILQLENLVDFDAANNEISRVPSSMSSLKLLRALRINNNKLTVLPDDLGQLPLQELNIATNQIARLPASLIHCKPKDEDDFTFAQNPLVYPPKDIALQGLSKIQKWMKANPAS